MTASPFPRSTPTSGAAADLNDDGWVDFLVSNFGETVRWRQESYIYWGNSEGFSVDSRSALMGVGSAGASIADLDRDGHLDVILSNSPRPEDGIKGAFIYWGSAEGFVVSQRGEVPGGGTSTVADLNRDGRPDLIFGGSEGVGIYLERRQPRILREPQDRDPRQQGHARLGGGGPQSGLLSGPDPDPGR